MKKLRLLTFISFNDNDIPPLNKKNNIYVSGWSFRVYELTAKYQDYFIGKYTLKAKYYKTNNLFLRMKLLKEWGNISLMTMFI